LPIARSETLLGHQGSKPTTTEPEEKGAAVNVGCIAGDAVVAVKGRGLVALAAAQAGDEVLVKSTGGVRFESLLGFLHAVRSRESAFPIVKIIHSGPGSLGLTLNHFVLAGPREAWTSKMARDVMPGDWLATADGGGQVQVLAVRRSATSAGVFAPLTPSGRFEEGAVKTKANEKPMKSTYAISSS
jgi:hypothetical protein